MSVLNQSEEATSPTSPASGRWKSYFKSAGMFFKNSSGVEEQVASVSYVDSLVNNDAWVSWTPTLDNITLGNGTLSCTYTVGANKVCNYRFQLVVGSTTAISATLLPTFTLPVLPSTGHLVNSPIGNLAIYDSSAPVTYSGIGVLETNSGTATVGLYINNVSGAYIQLAKLLDGSPITLATGDLITINGQFEY
jgi:hypothetical protein